MKDEAMYAILKRVQQNLSCPVCKRQFKLEELKVKGVLDKNFLIQASCYDNHPPALVLFIANSLKKNEHAISTDDVIDLHKTLKNFTGDFKSVFQKIDQANK